MATHHTDLGFSNIKQIARLYRRREVLKTGSVQEDEVFLITNLDHTELDHKQFLQLKRDYWQIENKLHYRLDFVFGEDRSTIRRKFGPQNMATLRNFALSLLMVNDVKNVKRCVDNIKYSSATEFYDSLF